MRLVESGTNRLLPVAPSTSWLRSLAKQRVRPLQDTIKRPRERHRPFEGYCGRRPPRAPKGRQKCRPIAGEITPSPALRPERIAPVRPLRRRSKAGNRLVPPNSQMRETSVFAASNRRTRKGVAAGSSPDFAM